MAIDSDSGTTSIEINGTVHATRWTLTLDSTSVENGTVTVGFTLDQEIIGGNGSFPVLTTVGSIAGQEQYRVEDTGILFSETFSGPGSDGDLVTVTTESTYDNDLSLEVSATVERERTFDANNVEVAGCGFSPTNISLGDDVTFSADVTNSNDQSASVVVNWNVVDENVSPLSATGSVPAGSSATIEETFTISQEYVSAISSPFSGVEYEAFVDTASPASLAGAPPGALNSPANGFR